MAQEHQSNFEEPANLTKWTKRFLYAQIVIAVIAIISNIIEYQLLLAFKNGVFISQQEQAMAFAGASDARQRVIGFISFSVFVAAGILILKWIYRANYNARQLGASDMVFTPAWSVGWYFIPIANWWKPYQVMREIWKASANPQNWRTESVPTLLLWWWFLWIVLNVSTSASLRLYDMAVEIDELITSNIANQLADITMIPLSLILITIVNRVHKMQISHAEPS